MKQIRVYGVPTKLDITREQIIGMIAPYIESDERITSARAVCTISKSGKSLVRIDVYNTGSKAVKIRYDVLGRKVQYIDRKKVVREVNNGN